MMMGWMGDKLLIYAKRDVDDWVSRVTIMLVLLQYIQSYLIDIFFAHC